MSTREGLIDEIYILRNRVKSLLVENEQLNRDYAMALDRIAALQEKLESLTEQKEDPYA
jgi:predicted nuclease with TOPRIM domain